MGNRKEKEMRGQVWVSEKGWNSREKYKDRKGNNRKYENQYAGVRKKKKNSDTERQSGRQREREREREK